MGIRPHNVNRNVAQIRMLYFQEMLRVIESQPKKVWEDTCRSFLDDHNAFTKEDNKQAKTVSGFSYQGEYYPPSITRQRKVILMRTTAELHPELHEEFEALRKNYVDEWNEAKRSFRGFLNKALTMAKSEAELSLLIPQYVLDRIEVVDFHPHPNAQGLDQAKADELLAQYPGVNKIHHLSALGALT